VDELLINYTEAKIIFCRYGLVWNFFALRLVCAAIAAPQLARIVS
jgi:hypothetical protein